MPPPVRGDSNDPNTPAVFGRNENGHAVRGEAPKGSGVAGFSGGWSGVYGHSDTNHGVVGESAGGDGTQGISHAAQHAGVAASNDAGGYAVVATRTGPAGGHPTAFVRTEQGHGVWSEAPNGTAVAGFSETWHGLYGKTASTTGGYAVMGEHSGVGVGVMGTSEAGVGVWGYSAAKEAVHAETKSPAADALGAYVINPDGGGAALHAENRGKGVGLFAKAGQWAGWFDGDVMVTGDLQLPNADIAEDFEVAAADDIEPGTVMVLGEDGAVEASRKAYDKRVAGVISGAGDLKPGILMDRRDGAGARRPVALMGKVYCKVDAEHGAIETGDLLTTSPTRGHAMKASSPSQAFGAVIGKALRPLPRGRELVPILVSLQ